MTEQSLEKESKTSSSIWARIVLIIISYFILAGIFQFVGGLIMNVPITAAKIVAVNTAPWSIPVNPRICGLTKMI